MLETELSTLIFRLDGPATEAVDAWHYVTERPTDEFFQRAAREFLAKELEKPGILEAMHRARVRSVRQLNLLQGTPMSPEEEELEAQFIHQRTRGIICTLMAGLGQLPPEYRDPTEEGEI